MGKMVRICEMRMSIIAVSNFGCCYLFLTNATLMNDGVFVVFSNSVFLIGLLLNSRPNKDCI